MMKKVALMQPTFLPWVGYFELIASVDLFVFLDNFQFSRQSWGQRNKLFLSPGKAGIITLPISHEKNLQATFQDIKPAADQRWKRKFLMSLRQSYAKTAYGQQIAGMCEKWLDNTYPDLADMLIAFIKASADILDISTAMIRSSQVEYDRQLSRSQRLLSLLDAVEAEEYYSAHGSFLYMLDDGVFPLKRLPVYFQDHQPVVYPQVGVETFVPYLSIVDAFCNLSTTAIRKIIHGTTKWLTWEQRAQKENVTSQE